MIKAVGKNKNGDTVVFLGLSRENTRRLHDDKPIVVHLQELDPRLPAMDVVLLADETEEAMEAKFKLIPGWPPPGMERDNGSGDWLGGPIG